ncbi:MAG: hypothetical protein ACHWZW_08045 [Spirulina sp.]
MLASMTLSKSLSSPLRWLRIAPRTLARAGVVAACVVAMGLGLEAQANHNEAMSLELALEAPVPALAQTASARSFPEPGQYLFGQSPDPDQIGSGYIVLNSDGQDIYGALYFPGSSFDCFRGRVEGNALAMTIIDSYSQEAYPYSIALDAQSPIATTQFQNGLAPLSLSGFHALETLSENDLRMLNTCQADLTVGQ